MSQVNFNASSLPVNPDLRNESSKSLNELDSNDFLQLLITELQNQDPLEPSDSVQMLQQVSQIRQITSNDSLISTMASVQSGQEVATASQMVGKRIAALSTENQEVEGEVQRVTITPANGNEGGREIRLHVGEHEVELSQVRSILSSTAT